MDESAKQKVLEDFDNLDKLEITEVNKKNFIFIFIFFSFCF
jgi:hypothetical protein